MMDANQAQLAESMTFLQQLCDSHDTGGDIVMPAKRYSAEDFDVNHIHMKIDEEFQMKKKKKRKKHKHSGGNDDYTADITFGRRAGKRMFNKFSVKSIHSLYLMINDADDAVNDMFACANNEFDVQMWLMQLCTSINDISVARMQACFFLCTLHHCAGVREVASRAFIKFLTDRQRWCPGLNEFFQVWRICGGRGLAPQLEDVASSSCCSVAHRQSCTTTPDDNQPPKSCVLLMLLEKQLCVLRECVKSRVERFTNDDVGELLVFLWRCLVLDVELLPIHNLIDGACDSLFEAVRNRVEPLPWRTTNRGRVLWTEGNPSSHPIAKLANAIVAGRVSYRVADILRLLQVLPPSMAQLRCIVSFKLLRRHMNSTDETTVDLTSVLRWLKEIIDGQLYAKSSVHTGEVEGGKRAYCQLSLFECVVVVHLCFPPLSVLRSCDEDVVTYRAIVRTLKEFQLSMSRRTTGYAAIQTYIITRVLDELHLRVLPADRDTGMSRLH